MQALNPILVMLLIPFNNLVLFPALRRMGLQVTALRRMGWGIAFSGVAWVAAGTIQLHIDGGSPTSIVWQTLPYVLLTFGEVLVSATGLEFAYSQAPPSEDAGRPASAAPADSATSSRSLSAQSADSHPWKRVRNAGSLS